MVIPSLCLILPWVQFSNPPDCQEVLAGAIISTDFTLEQTNFHKVQQPCLCSQQPQAAEMNPRGCGEPATVQRASDRASFAAARQEEKVQQGCKATSEPICPLPVSQACQTARAASNTSLLVLWAIAFQPAFIRGKVHFQISLDLLFYHPLRNSALKFFFPKKDLHGSFTFSTQWIFPVDDY